VKHLLLAFLITTFSAAAGAADLLPGYVVMANHDTVHCKIKGGKFLSNPFYRVTIVSETGEEETLPSQTKKIIAFGFVEKLRSFHYLFVDVGDKLESGFYQLVVDGLKYQLYGRPATLYGGNPTYVLFNPKRDFKKFEPCVLCPWKKQLRELFKDDPAALQHLENASRVDIPSLVIDLNKS
jgi:hypothetical protein